MKRYTSQNEFDQKKPFFIVNNNNNNNSATPDCERKFYF